jgi:4-amino-4-deoxy-L-arabinose transferase-like glycosyltransferase
VVPANLPRHLSTITGLIVVIALFCAPLFVGLGGWDLRSDEAIYSYSVDRILETGDWLTPRSIQVDGPFLEKPPLKFWIVAALIKAGVVPHDEVGYRFADALMGAIAFIYIYFLGWRLAGVVCGVVAVLVTFSMDAIVFEHGLRSNNMEAPLFLAYCAGMYHFARWVDGNDPRSQALIAALAFALGFMTKFVAALFLPALWLVAIVLIGNVRRRFVARWADWILPAVVAIAAIVPWFWYQNEVNGKYFWEVILGLHIYTRFTGALDPSHLQPWHYYFTETWRYLQRGPMLYATVPALIAATFYARRATWQLTCALIWFVVPLLAISFGTSKLYHYAYPFLPPLGLITGWAVAEVMTMARGQLGAMLARPLARLQLPERAWVVRDVAAAVAIAAIALSVMTAVSGRIDASTGGVKLFQNSSIARPLLISALSLLLAGRAAMSVVTLVALAVAMLLPVASYDQRVARVKTVDRRFTAIRDCATNVRTVDPSAAGGVYNAARTLVNHSHYYYLFRLGPWTEPQTAGGDDVRARMFDRAQQTIALMSKEEYDRWRSVAAATSLPLPPAAVVDGVIVVTPGPYSRCASATVAAGATRPSAG